MVIHYFDTIERVELDFNKVAKGSSSELGLNGWNLLEIMGNNFRLNGKFYSALQQSLNYLRYLAGESNISIRKNDWYFTFEGDAKETSVCFHLPYAVFFQSRGCDLDFFINYSVFKLGNLDKYKLEVKIDSDILSEPRLVCLIPPTDEDSFEKSLDGVVIDYVKCHSLNVIDKIYNALSDERVVGF